MPSVLFDALVVANGKKAIDTLANVGHALEFIKDQYRHGKPILALGAAASLLESAGVPAALLSGDPDPGVLVGDFIPTQRSLSSRRPSLGIALAAEGVMTTRMGCLPEKGDARRHCCNQAHAAIVVAGTSEPVWLAGGTKQARHWRYSNGACERRGRSSSVWC